MQKNQKTMLMIAIIVIVLIVVSFLINIFTQTPILDSLRIVFGSVFVLLIPGLVISYIFFPKTLPFEEGKEDKKEREKGSVDWIERISLSFALSIAIVPLAVFYLNLIGVKINLINSILTILGIIVIALIIIFIKNRFKKTKEK